MSAAAVLTQSPPYRLREYHAFDAAESRFLYLVPSGAIFALDDIGRDVTECLGEQERAPEELIELLLGRGYERRQIQAALVELEQSEVVARGEAVRETPTIPGRTFPLQRIVLNVTNQCNLACGYCYEYSADKISKTEGKPKYMEEDIAQSAIDMLIRESADRPAIHVTFFGGETLLNFPSAPVQRGLRQDANQRRLPRRVEFSLTTNATLLNEEMVDFLSEHRIGVTVSIDGDRELNDKMRVFHDGRGSYDVIVPKIKMLLQRHRTNSIGARVTLSSGVSHVRRIYEHLTQEVGFGAVGFSPATANPDRLYSIGTQKMSSILGGFEELAWEYRDRAVEGRQHGFTNANDTIKELHSGISKAYPCGAGLGLLGVGTAGDISLCHRFVDSPVGKMGHLKEGGIDHAARNNFLDTHTWALVTTATPVGRGRSAPVAAITRPLFTTAIHPLPICTIAIGFVAGMIFVCGFTGRSASEIRRFKPL